MRGEWPAIRTSPANRQTVRRWSKPGSRPCSDGWRHSVDPKRPSRRHRRRAHRLRKNQRNRRRRCDQPRLSPPGRSGSLRRVRSASCTARAVANVQWTPASPPCPAAATARAPAALPPASSATAAAARAGNRRPQPFGGHCLIRQLRAARHRPERPEGYFRRGRRERLALSAAGLSAGASSSAAGFWSPSSLVAGHTANTGQRLQPTASATGQITTVATLVGIGESPAYRVVPDEAA